MFRPRRKDQNIAGLERQLLIAGNVGAASADHADQFKEAVVVRYRFGVIRVNADDNARFAGLRVFIGSSKKIGQVQKTVVRSGFFVMEAK